jgi:hypothetical protein
VVKLKRIYEFSVDELKRKSRKYNTIFWFYMVAALVLNFINFFFGVQSLNNVMSTPDKDYGFILMLSLVFISIMFLFMIFLWLVSESSYYKMLQLNADMMIYLKGKLGE